MKTLKFPLVLLVILGFAACNKNNQRLSNPNVTFDSNDQAADIVSNSLAVNSNGAVNMISDFTLDAQVKATADTTCGTAWVDSVSRTSAAGSATTYSYKSKYSYTINCTNGVYNGSATSDLAYSGSYNGPNLSSANAGSSIFTTTGLRKDSANYVVNGEYKSSGSFQSKVDTSYAGSSNVDIVITNLTIAKPYREIKSGTATITVSGTMPKKGSFNFTGTLVFNGGNTATLTLNGTVYLINLLTGDKIRR